MKIKALVLGMAAMGLTLVGFLRGRRFVIYAGEERIAVSVSVPAAAQ